MKKTVIASLLLSILAGCGGGAGVNLGTKIEPPTPIATNDFLQMAAQASCANLSNRLFVIDQSQVLSAKAGSCADASYSQTLYGATPQTILCQAADSIAGPQINCTDPKNTAMFKTIIANLDKADLGLGAAHQVQQLNVPAGSNVTLAFSALDTRFYYGIAPANVVIRDKDAWGKLVTAGKLQTPLSFDGQFTNTMVLGTFFKNPNNCSITQILRISSNGQKIQAEYADQERIAVMSCDASGASASTPVNFVEVKQSNLPVEFNNINAQILSANVFVNERFSAISSARNTVVKDQTTWEKLWAEHSNGSGSAPLVDFTKNMAIGVFLGQKPSGCYGIGDLTIWRSNGQIHVSHHDTSPGKGVMCTTEVPSPVYIALIPRSDDVVDFTAIPILH